MDGEDVTRVVVSSFFLLEGFPRDKRSFVVIEGWVVPAEKFLVLNLITLPTVT